MPTWGPFTCSVGPGLIHAEDLRCTLYDSGSLTGQVVRQITGSVDVTWSGGRSDAAWGVRIYCTDVNGHEISVDQVVISRLSTPHMTWDFLTPITTNRFRIEYAHSVYVGQSSTATASGSFSQDVYCPYGTQVKGQYQAVVYLTPELISLMCSFVSAPWLEVPLSIFAFTTIAVQVLCLNPPPPLPAITGESTGLGIEYWRQVLQSIAWAYFCECSPGAPAPPPYPAPAPIQPPNWPVPPTFTCDDTDICASIVEIKRQLAALSQTLAMVSEVTTLTQRYRAPFAYIRGARHPNLAGTGSFPVPRTVGYLVDVIARPGDLQTFTGNPPYLTDLGWLGIHVDNILVEEVRLTRDLQIWLPASATAARSFAWALRDDVVIGVTELYAEP